MAMGIEGRSLAVSLLMGLAAVFHSAPVVASSRLQISVPEENCRSTAEAAPAAGVLALVGTGLIKGGVQAAAAGLRRASGVDNTSHPVEAYRAGYLYSLRNGELSVANDVRCFTVRSEREGGFEARITARPSMDRSAMQFELEVMSYPRAEWAGRRRVTGAVVGLEITTPDGKAFASVAFPGTLQPGAQNHQTLTSGWVPLPAPSTWGVERAAAFQAVCARREAARQVYLGRNGDPEAFPENKCLEAPEPGALDLHGRFIRWTGEDQKALEALQRRYDSMRANPVNVRVILTETTDVNRFLVALSTAISGAEAGLTEAIANEVIPARAEAVESVDAGRREAFELARSTFDARALAWRLAGDRVREAEQALAEATAAGRPQSEITALVRARDAEIQKREDAWRAAIEARNVARTAARTAGIVLPYTDPLMSFGAEA